MALSNCRYWYILVWIVH